MNKREAYVFYDLLELSDKNEKDKLSKMSNYRLKRQFKEELENLYDSLEKSSLLTIREKVDWLLRMYDEMNKRHMIG